MSTISSSELLLLGPDECMKFVRENFPSKFDWHRLAEGAASKSAEFTVLREETEENGLKWMRLAVELYERMADHPSMGHDSRVRLTIPALAKRSQAIELWGAKKDDPLLSIKNLIFRFKSIVDVTPEEIVRDVEIPRPSSIRIALLATQFFEPLLKIDAVKNEVCEIAEYCRAAQTARENARTRTFN